MGLNIYLLMAMYLSSQLELAKFLMVIRVSGGLFLELLMTPRK